MAGEKDLQAEPLPYAPWGWARQGRAVLPASPCILAWECVEQPRTAAVTGCPLLGDQLGPLEKPRL